MTLRIKLLGFEIAKIELDLDGGPGTTAPTTVVEKGVKKLSKRWVGWMVS